MKKLTKKYITKNYGKRCETKDTEDFPDLKKDERCLCCLMWERYDKQKTQRIVKEVVEKYKNCLRELAKR